MGKGLHFLKAILPAETRFILRRQAARVRNFGLSRYCPVCGSHVRRFLPGGVTQRPNVACPVCDAAERHRLAWFYLTRRTDLLDGRPKRLLHVAPEYEFKRQFERVRCIDYFSASLNGVGTRAKVDVTAIPFADCYFDAIYCSHVLEHVTDDHTAMREFCRVLKAGGWAVLQVPIEPGLAKTFEDPSVINPRERLRLFGQEDHVRLYGRDYADRLREAGFSVQELSSLDVVGERNMESWGIDATETVFLCKKQ